MRAQAHIRGVKSLISKLENLAIAARKDGKATVAVGYNAFYALWVHENIEMKLKGKPRKSGIGVYWGPNGQAKFLEAPARQLTADGTLGKIVWQALKRGLTLAQGLFTAGLRLQRDSQRVVPREFSNLHGSAFTILEK